MTISIVRIDHLVLTVRDIRTTVEFYSTVLGMEARSFGDNRTALHFGIQKINLHQAGAEIEPKALNPTPGSADVCFITDVPLDSVVDHLQRVGIDIELGPVPRTGATDSLQSIYIRDPDQNLIEISNIK